MARPPDWLALLIESVHEFPVLRIQSPYEPCRNATQRHPVAVIPRSVIGDGVDEAVAAIFFSTPVFAVLQEEGVAKDSPWEHCVAKLGSWAPGQPMISGLHDTGVPRFLNPEMMRAVRAGVTDSVIPVSAYCQIEDSIDTRQP